jgi:hypothetical protein
LQRIGQAGCYGNDGMVFNLVDVAVTHAGGNSEVDIMAALELRLDKPFNEVPANDEDAFIKALEDGGLASVQD